MVVKTSNRNESCSGLYECWFALVLVLVVLAGVSSCSKNDSANSNTDNANTAETADVASPSPAAPSPTPPNTTAAFQGTWTNKNPSTANNTKLVIIQNDSDLKVHAWGKCTPTDCDWGEQSGGIVDDAAVITWDQGFVIRKMKLTLEGSNELRSVTESVYNDSRPRRRSEEVFVKQS